jgi:DNA-binding MltR family transcriptional regulator
MIRCRWRGDSPSLGSGQMAARKKQTLRDFTREFPLQEDQDRFRGAMNADSDLVVAIVSAIEVEYLLEEAIILKLKRTDDGTLELLTRENGSLSSFFSKIGLAYALKIIDETRMEYINVVRRIRNAFAHSRKDISFSNPLILGEIARLKLPSKKRSHLYRSIDIAKRLVTVKLPDEPALVGRAAYVILTMSLAAYFIRRRKRSSDAQFRRFRAALGAHTSAGASHI